MRTHLVQLDIRWEDPPANHGRTLELLEHAGVEPGDLIILPEMFAVGFTLNLDRATDDAGTTRAFLSALAARFRCTVQGGLAVRPPDDPLATNRMAIFDGFSADPPKHLGDYAKVHPFSYGKEPRSFRGGDSLLTYAWSSPTEMLRVCPAVCYDLRFPELFRQGLRLGAECFAIGANWPRERQPHWRALTIARAIENQAYVLAVNRAGDDPHLSYAGGSIVVDPRGEVVAELGPDEGILSAEVAPDAVRGWRDTFPAWRDHRLLPELGEPL